MPHLCPQVSVLVFIALAFLTCVVFLVVYKVYKYERLCPDGFILKVKAPRQLRTACHSTSRHPRVKHSSRCSRGR